MHTSHFTTAHEKDCGFIESQYCLPLRTSAIVSNAQTTWLDTAINSSATVECWQHDTLNLDENNTAAVTYLKWHVLMCEEEISTNKITVQVDKSAAITYHIIYHQMDGLLVHI